jgi:tRNA pseudouridine32 synthase / 23S rRNA pseudouridine746 synthase
MIGHFAKAPRFARDASCRHTCRMIPPHASTLRLPPGAWVTVIDCLCDHFAAIPRATWLDRLARGRILDADGNPVAFDHAYREGLTIHYFREVADEPVIPFEAVIVHVDDEIVVADKPHFLAVAPAGRFVEQTLLRRLIDELGNPDLVPLHRIDRATAGLVMFSANPETRAHYHALFSEQQIEKAYEAIAPALNDVEFPLVRRSRIVAGTPFFRMQEEAGPANSETRIDVIARTDPYWRYALRPTTGRTHQLRVQMAALGAGILNDNFYPQLKENAADDFARPLKLLARSLAFVDPVDGSARQFQSRFAL